MKFSTKNHQSNTDSLQDLKQSLSGSDKTKKSESSPRMEKYLYVPETIAYELVSQLALAVNAAFPGLDLKPEDINLEHPTAEDHGDYSTNLALKLGKDQNTNPKDLAAKIVEHLNQKGTKSIKIDQISIAGPGFINFKLSPEMLIEEMEKVLEKKEKYGSSDLGEGKTVVIDYSAPNIAKRFGIGHLRSTIIGQALYNLSNFMGYKVIGDNHLGDWGTQFGKIMYMIDQEKPEELSLEKLEELYVKFHQMAKDNPDLEVKGREWFKRLEDSDLVARNLWKKCVDISMAEFDRIYGLLGVKIDFAYGESFYEDKMPGVIKDAKVGGVAKQSNGAWIIDIPGHKTPLLLIKSDGGTTYATRDLATLKFRKDQWNPDIVIYEVGGEQALYFSQLFAAARILNYVKPDAALIHTKHGLYRWEHGKFSTREGNTIKLEEILNEAIVRAQKIMAQRKIGKDMSGQELEDVSKAVGIGAVKYFDLKHGVQNDIVFDWENMFALDGDSGPYIQYTYARARSVLRKSLVTSHLSLAASDQSPMTGEELSILRFLYRFPEIVEIAARTYSPNLVCSYLFELARRFNNFYNNVPILGEDQSEFRLALTESSSIVLKNGLNLLGIKVLEKM